MRTLVLGDIGWRTYYHLGDEAMAEVASCHLTAEGGEVMLVGATPETTQEMYGKESVPRIGFNAKHTRKEKERLLEGGVSQGNPAFAEMEAALDVVDAVVISGGGNLNSAYPHHIFERLALARLAAARSIPLVVSGQALGPNLSFEDRPLVAELIALSRAFGVRDDVSAALARRIGGPDAPLWRVPDDAVDVASLATTDLDVRLPDAFIVGTFEGPPAGWGADEYYDTVAHFLDRIAVRTGLGVRLVPHAGDLTGAEEKFDDVSHREIVRRTYTGLVEPLPLMRAGNVASIMRRSVLAVGTRYHPAIIGPAAGTPALPLAVNAYGEMRLRGALNTFGLDGFLSDIRAAAAGQLDRVVERIIGQSASLSAHLDSVARERVDNVHAWWDVVRATLSGDEVSRSTWTNVPEYVTAGVIS